MTLDGILSGGGGNIITDLFNGGDFDFSAFLPLAGTLIGGYLGNPELGNQVGTLAQNAVNDEAGNDSQFQLPSFQSGEGFLSR